MGKRAIKILEVAVGIVARKAGLRIQNPGIEEKRYSKSLIKEKRRTR